MNIRLHKELSSDDSRNTFPKREFCFKEHRSSHSLECDDTLKNLDHYHVIPGNNDFAHMLGEHDCGRF